MDEDSENCCKLHGLRHEQREAQHGGGGGGDDGAIPHPNLTSIFHRGWHNLLPLSNRVKFQQET